MRRKSKFGLCGILACLCCILFSSFGCTFSPNPAPSEPEKQILRTDGDKIVDGDGNEVRLRGVNAAGLFITENWMNGFSNAAAGDYRTATNILTERFGKAQTLALWQEYRENWWSEADFVNCARMGINVIRLPFTYMVVDFDATADLTQGGQSYDFSAIDAFVAKAKQYGMYTILDLHGAYGSQNGQDHSGEVLSREEVDFYSDERKISLTENLWSAIAERYKDEPAVAGYDLLNEPGEKAEETCERHWQVFDRLYSAIRRKDSRHIVIFESCWGAANLPRPKSYGWENCMYSFHHYTGAKNDYNAHRESFSARVEEIVAADFGVPVQMGEFTCYENLSQWEYTLGLLNEQNVHWCVWAYKLNPSKASAWGIVYKLTAEADKVNVQTDSYEEILQKFALLKTDEDTLRYVVGERTLESVITQYAK